MSKITLSIVAIAVLYSSTTSTVKADFWSETRDKIINIGDNEHLENIDFSTIYSKAFYKKSYFGWVITGVAVVGAGAVSYFSAGTGAPVAATGVGSVAAWVGGGSGYMAGLATIGSWFGGNAMVGAAILNGLSIGAIGGGLGAKIATMGILAKVGMGVSVTALSLDGIAYFKNPETHNMEYAVRVIIPQNIGSKEVRYLVDKIYETEDENRKIREENEDLKKDIKEAFFDSDYGKRDKLKDKLKKNIENYNKTFIDIGKYKQKAVGMLEQKPISSFIQEDLLVLGIIAANQRKYDLFDKAISGINRSKLDDMGFLYYLDGLNSLYHGNEERTLTYLQNAMDSDKYALEPVILSINILGYSNFEKNEFKIQNFVKFAEKNFDSDDYASPLSMVSIYYRVGTLYFVNGRYIKARQYYEKAKDSLGFLQKHFFGKQLKHTIELSIANAIYKEGKITTSNNLYKEILDDIDKEDIDELKKIKGEYIGNHI